ncbi:MAG: right-handed parallel beta-helix repeat-containing protein, partial [Planctomycetota bacterium]
MNGRRNLDMVLAVCVFLAALAGPATGRTIYVDPNGSADFTTIQAAINDPCTVNGDQIEVVPGTYNEAINFNGKAVRLYSADGPNDTTIDGTGNYHVVQCVNGEDANTILEGFTITGGNANGGGSNNYGGGMYCESSSPTVTGCKFSNNSAGAGGGLFNWSSSPSLTDCNFSNNPAGWGGGMHNGQSSSPSVTNCTFTGNTASTNGGGMYNVDSSNPTLTGCTFTGNSAPPSGAGGGLFNWSGSPSLTDCNFSNNSAGWGGGVYNNQSSSPTVTGCRFSGNEVTDEGGGMYNANNSNPTLTGCTFSGNSAEHGGGMFNEISSSPAVTNCIFTGNSATISGGGMFNLENSNATVSECTFSGNEAGWGGGMCNDHSSPEVNNCSFSDNNSVGGDGGGGMMNFQSTATLVNCVFFNNSSANVGGGMLNVYGSLTVINCTFTGNSAGLDGGGMFNDWDSNPTVTNCILWGDVPNEIVNNHNSNPAVTYSDVQGGYSGTGNINADPMFADADGRLLPGSPCVGAGNNGAPGLPAEDMDGNPRIIGNFVDMGAFECTELPIHNVTADTFYDRIQTAIDDANNGNEIEVAPGMYYEALNFNGKAVRLYSSSGPEVTTIDGSGHYHVVQCVTGEDANTSLEGFTITGGWADGPDPNDRGGGMYNLNSSPTVTNCNFTGNSATAHGGGIYNYISSPTVNNCTFTGNSAGWGGGGMYNNNHSSPAVTNCTFTTNSADYGGGMFNYGSSPTVTNCTFSGNSADRDGGGIYNYGSSPTVTNSTFTSNSADYGGGIYNYSGSPTVTNCIFWGDTPDEINGGGPSVTYCDIHGGYTGLGNIDIYPGFVDAGAGDFRLTWYSPCIDSGDNGAPGLPASDLAGNPRVADGDGDGNAVVDMGAYELEAGMSKVGVGTLAVTIEPNEAIDAGAKWKVEGGEQWYNSGEVVSVAPGYHRVEVNELPGWYEPETLLVGYDTLDPNNVWQQNLWVRVIGDMNATATAEYKPAPVFAIGEIPPRDAPHGRIDPCSGLFIYEPNDANDRTAFAVTFRAESGVDVNEQTVEITPIADLALEYEIVSRPVQDFPDPCDDIFVNEILSEGPQTLNGILHDTVRSVTIGGKLIEVADVPHNPVYVYNDNNDINDLTIHGETVVISDPLRLPQTSVTIYAAELCFEGEVAYINTTPIDLRPPPGTETAGLNAGNIRLYIESYGAAGELKGRLIMNGTKGYHGGPPGDDGVLTCTLDTQQPLAWLSPYALKMVIAHARDAYLYRYTAETHDILSEYEGLLSTYMELSDSNRVRVPDANWPFEFEQMHQEIITLVHRIDNGLDYFGNPPDWVPALSFEVLYTVYEQEIERAMRVMYLSYWLQNKEKEITEKETALSNGRSQLWDDTVQAKEDYIICKDLIGPLKARANSIASRVGTADGECYGLLCDLKNKEAELLERAKKNVHEAHKVPWWKTAGRVLSTIGTSVMTGAGAGSVAGPKGAAAGAIVGGVVGSISVLTDDSIMNPNPWPQASLRTDVAKQFHSIDFEQATEGWMDDFNDIEEGDIEANGVGTYLQNLRASAADMADGLWGVKEALKTTSLDNEEVETALSKIKASDPTFNRLVDDVTELMVEKQLFNRQVAAAMQKVATLSNSMTNNVLAIDALNRDASRLNRIVDPRVNMYVKDMERRALARLRKYHYYMAKAYEYRLVEPYPGDLNIDEMIRMMIDYALVDPNGTLSDDDFGALKVVYEEQLSTLAEHILDEFFMGGHVEENVTTEYGLSEEEIIQLNAGEAVMVNLFEEGLFPSDRENIRIVDMNVLDDINVVVTGDCGSYGYVVLTMYHPSISKLQWKDDIYLF